MDYADCDNVPELVGNHSVKKNAQIMSKIPSKEDLAEMEGFALNSIMQKCVE